MVTKDVAACPRCGAKHDGLKFKPLKRPQGGFNYWAPCPDTKEPVMAAVTVEVEAAPPAAEAP